MKNLPLYIGMAIETFIVLILVSIIQTLWIIILIFLLHPVVNTIASVIWYNQSKGKE